MISYSQALRDFLAEGAQAGGWAALPFFHSDAAHDLLHRIDARAAAGITILPGPGNLFAALGLTPLNDVRVIILGQDPYPTPEDAHGLAFSYAGARRLPASLKNIFKELADDIAGPVRMNGNLSDWAGQGVLLLNSALTVEAGSVGAHMKWGWHHLMADIMRTVGAKPEPCVFILWGDKARAFKPLIGPQHLVIESPHPSPLSAYRGFFGSKPFSRSNAFLQGRGRGEIDWLGTFPNHARRTTS